MRVKERKEYKVSPSVFITRRRTASGFRYVVRFRFGGGKRVLHDVGRFHTLKEARVRRDWAKVELAAGRDPRVTLTALGQPTPWMPGLRVVFDTYIAARGLNVGESALGSIRAAAKKWCLELGEATDPATLTVNQLQETIAKWHREGLGAATIKMYRGKLTNALDHAKIRPNPARDETLQLPKKAKKTIEVPLLSEFDAVLASVRTERCRFYLTLMECLAIRGGELAKLRCGDVDVAEGCLRIPRDSTKSDAGARAVPVPPELLAVIVDRVDGRERTARVFTDLHVNGSTLRDELRRSCERAGLKFTAHMLRHRRISLWQRHGFDIQQIIQWAGHATASESLDTYGHVIADGDRWERFWFGTYIDTRKQPHIVLPEEAE